MTASSSQQRWNAGTIPVTKSSQQTSSWWTLPQTRSAFMEQAKVEHQTRMRFATVTGITNRAPIGYWPVKATDV